ncbi:MAG: 2-hydroxyacyl-CoA dehydratase [Candidatus Riflebacteria bacterium]|nr:2-hydroxyacyl-CoA dehydratase [Candidatus Riflebacteria bacterium]
MSQVIARITLDEWDRRYEQLHAGGLREPSYGGPLGRHAVAGDRRLTKLTFDRSTAALRLWNFLLTEDERLAGARGLGVKLLGTMKDLGTVPVMAASFDDVVAFYPDGAWWIPCLMENEARLLEIADRLGVDESFCPVRAMLGAFVNQRHFPVPDLLTCSVGATCDDVSAIAQRLAGMGHRIAWWEMPHRRRPEPGEETVLLSGGFTAPARQVEFVRTELHRILLVLEEWTGQRLADERLLAGIVRANRVRAVLGELRRIVYGTDPCPMPALEMLVAEMLAIHFCSDEAESLRVLEELLVEVRSRVESGVGVLPAGAVKVFWVNPVADLRVMNLLEDVGGRVCGTDYMFCHALDPIPEDLPPLDALARMALADPMVGPATDRAERIVRDASRSGAQAVVLSQVPGASHCGLEGLVIGEVVRARLGIPFVEIEVGPITDSIEAGLRTRLEALIETVEAGGRP